MPIEIKSVADGGFIFKTTLIDDDDINMDIYIYKENQDCEKYFTIEQKYNYIAYNDETNFYIVTLKGLDLSEEDRELFKKEFKACGEPSFLQKKSLEKRMLVNKISEKVLFININSDECHTSINLTVANKEIDKLNFKLVTSNYTLKLNYIFEIENETHISAFSLRTPIKLLLCIYNNNACVSSLVITYNDTEKEISIDSKTKDGYGNKKLNKL